MFPRPQKLLRRPMLTACGFGQMVSGCSQEAWALGRFWWCRAKRPCEWRRGPQTSPTFPGSSSFLVVKGGGLLARFDTDGEVTFSELTPLQSSLLGRRQSVSSCIFQTSPSVSDLVVKILEAMRASARTRKNGCPSPGQAARRKRRASRSSCARPYHCERVTRPPMHPPRSPL
jgi:hypothetical protein